MDGAAGAGATTRFVTGPHVGVVSDSVLALIASDDPIIRARLSRLEHFADVVSVLAEPSMLSAAAVIAVFDGSGVEITARGSARADVQLPDGSTAVVNAPIGDSESSHEQQRQAFADVVCVVLHESSDASSTAPTVTDPDDDLFSIASGVFPALKVIRRDSRYRGLPTEAVEVIPVDTVVEPVIEDDTVVIERDHSISVLAVRCPRGHLNAAHAATCRVCGDAVEESRPVRTTRPPLGVLVFSDGTRATLDRTIVVGRDPACPTDEPDATLVGLAESGQGLSRTHAHFSLAGWQILVDDQQSTNGTVVTLPGQSPRRLRAGEPAVLVRRSRVDFGGAISCIVEAFDDE